jgi:Asp-tRNA(Asn)/Glu-tRNA(Gln) amidotransferase A subunit family amidase
LVAQDASDTVQSAVASGAGADSLLQYRATADATVVPRLATSGLVMVSRRLS